MRVGISTNNEAKVQLAKDYFEVNVNPKTYNYMPKLREKR